MERFFSELGRKVFSRWKDRNFSLAAFPEIARTSLEERPPARHVDMQALIREFLFEDELPFQTQSGFGQPELVVYDNPRFYIQVLFWLDGTTDIHQHKFSGAFHVMKGSSIHSLFEFENPLSITANFRMGQLVMKETKLLETGATEEIVSGSGHIHSLFHLEAPSVSVVIRTHSDPGTGPQFTYLPPHLAVDPTQNDALTMRRKQLLDLLERTGDPGYAELVMKMLDGLDFERGFFILQNAMPHLLNIGRWDEVWEVFERKHGMLSEYVLPTLDEIARRDRIVELRKTLEDADHRFFLALLLNIPDREDIFQFVAQRYPEPPVDTIMRWAEECGTVSDRGAWILDAEFPADVEVTEGAEFGAFLSVLRNILDPELPPDDELSPEGVERIREVVAGSAMRALMV